jgi:arylsulfatase A
MKTGALLPLLLASSLGPLTAATAQAARYPSIVVIFVDDQGYADIGPFGAKDYPTPHLDRMAREGCRFTNFHVAQPVCSASRAAMLTGCYSNRIGIHSALFPRAKHGLAHGEITLAELVKQRGYATGMAGKWHLGDHPQFLPPRHGFDSSFGLPYSNDMWPFHPQPPVAFPPLPLIKDGEIIKPALDAKDQDQLTVQYTEHAVKFIEQNKDRPFFFYLAHSMVHVPLHVSERFRGKSKHGLYGDACMEVDWSVGEVLAALERCGIDDDTWVIYTSDNGPWLSYGNHAGSTGPLREGKGTNWEGGTRVPTIMRWLGRIPANSTNDTMLMTIDLFPTIAKLIDVPLPDHKIDGLDVWPVIEGRKTPPTHTKVMHSTTTRAPCRPSQPATAVGN